MNLLNLRLASKLWLSSFLIVLGILLVVGYAAYRSSSDRAESTQTLEKLNERIQLSLRWSGHTLENAARTKSQLAQHGRVAGRGNAGGYRAHRRSKLRKFSRPSSPLPAPITNAVKSTPSQSFAKQ
jgi:Tfp pilus assembly protein PilE